MRRNTIRLWSGVGVAVVAAGSALAIATFAQAGDFNDEPAYDFDCDDKRDGLDADMDAIVDGQTNAGAVTVQYSKTGEKATISQATEGLGEKPEYFDNFGWAVAAYDETGDGCDDLIVSAPDEDVADKYGRIQEDAGMIWVIPGSQSGLDTASARGINLDSPGVPGVVSPRDGFGRVLAADSGTEESMIVVGAPGTDDEAGAAYFLRGELAYKITQDSPGVSGASEPKDRFGSTIAITDRYYAIGVGAEKINGQARAGMAHVFGLELVNDSPKQLAAFHQDSAGISGKAEKGDAFGGSMSIVPYRPTPASKVRPLVSVGSPLEDVNDGSGMAHLITIPSAGKYQQIASVHEDTAGVPGTTEGGDVFGKDTVLALTDSAAIGTPATTRWVASAIQDGPEEQEDKPEVFVFGVSGKPGDDVTVISQGDFGLPADTYPPTELSAGPGYLHLGRMGDAVTGVPWGNILNGENEPIVVYEVTE